MDLLSILNRIENLCKKKNLKRQNVYIDCGVGKNFGVSMRNGSEPSIGKMTVLADYLDCSVDYLLGRTNDPQAHKSAASVTVGDVSGNNGAIGVGNTVTNGATPLDEHQKLLIDLYNQLSPIEQVELLNDLHKRKK